MGFGKCGVLPHLRGWKVAQSPMRGVAVSRRHGLDGLAQPIKFTIARDETANAARLARLARLAIQTVAHLCG